MQQRGQTLPRCTSAEEQNEHSRVQRDALMLCPERSAAVPVARSGEERDVNTLQRTCNA